MIIINQYTYKKLQNLLLHQEYKSSDEEYKLMQMYYNLCMDLMNKRVLPKIEAQEHFVDMCYGKVYPKDNFELRWQKYRIELFFRIANIINANYDMFHYDYNDLVEYYARIALQNHSGAIEWFKKENIKIDIPENPPLINIARIYLKVMLEPQDRTSRDVMDLFIRFKGSYGSKQ